MKSSLYTTANRKYNEEHMNPESPFQPQPTPQGGGQQPPQQPQYANGQPLYGQYGPAQPQPVAQQQAPIGYAPQPAPQPGPQSQHPNGPRARKNANIPVIMAVVFLVTTLGFGGAFTWALVNYFDQKDNVDSKITIAQAETKKEVEDKAEVAYAEKEKQPNRQFAGPEDYGRVSFDYPKTWSIYVAKDVTSPGSTYEAYFNPVIVPAVAVTQQYALRVTIESKDYDKVIDSYKQLVTKGDLKSSAVKADDQNGTRLDGAFTKDIHGSAVIFKIRDKTVTVRTDAQAFTADFDALIKTVTFNK